MNIKELAKIFGISDEELLARAKEIDLDLASIGELDETLIGQLKERLHVSMEENTDVSKGQGTSAETPHAEDVSEHIVPKEQSQGSPIPDGQGDSGLADLLNEEPVHDGGADVEADREIITPLKDRIMQKGQSFLQDFFFPIFNTPVHRNILIIGALVSAVIGITVASLVRIQTTSKISDIKQNTEVQVNIRGGFRGKKDLFQLIWEMHEQGYYQLAYDYAERFLEEYHDSDLVGDVYFKKADIVYDWDRGSDTRRYKEARAAYEKAIHYSPNDTKVPWAYLQIANTYFILNIFDAAAEAYKDLINRYPTYKDLDIAQSRLALCYLKLHEYNRAQLEYKRLLEVFSNSTLRRNAYFKLAEIHYRKKEFKESIDAYREYLTSYPHSPRKTEVHFRIAKLYKYLREYPHAITNFEESMGTYPNDTYNEIALYQIGECNLLLENYDTARDYYQKLVETYPKSKIAEVAYHRMGDAYLKADDEENAITMYENALSSFPDVKVSRASEVKLAELYYKHKKYDQAVTIFSDMLISDPNYFANDRIVLRLAQIHMQKGNHLEAIDWYLRLIREFPASPLVKKAYFDKAEAEMTSHFYEQAVKSYLEFIKKFPDHPRIDLITYFIGKMYFELEQYLKAIDYWEDLRSKFPLSDYRYVALERIGKTYMTMAQSDDYITFLKDGKHATGTVDEIRSSLELKGVETYLMIVDNKALEGSDEFFNAGKELATYYCRKEKLDKGLEVLNKLIGLYTAHPSVYTLLQLKAQIYYDLNVPDETVAAYEDLISLLTYKLSQGEEKNKNDYLIMIADAYFALGDLFYSQDRISESLYLYLEGVKKLPESEKRGWPLYQIANCYSNLDNYNKANYYYEKLKEEFPDNFWSEYVGWNKERLKWKEDMKEKGVRLKS